MTLKGNRRPIAPSPRRRAPKRVAIVGIHRDAALYRDACRHHGLRLVGLVGPDSKLRSELVGNTGLQTYDDLDALIGSGVRVDLLVIIEKHPPTSLELVLRAGEQRWAVLCEDRFTDVADEARRMFAKADDDGWKLMFADAFGFEMEPMVAFAASPAFGGARHVTAGWDCSRGADGERWTPFPGQIWLVMLAVLRMGMTLFDGQDPLRVSAELGDLRPWAQLEYPDGRLLDAWADVSTDRPDDLITVTAAGPGTMLEARERKHAAPKDARVRWRRAGSDEWFGVGQLRLKAEAYERVLGAALAELGGGPSSAPAGVRLSAVIEALHRSHAQGGGAVPLP